jgi:hypothetical protein
MCAQVGSVGTGGVCLVGGDRAGGRVRGGPSGPRTLIFARTAANWGLSPAWPRVRTNESGRQQRSADRWTLPVSLPRERLSVAAASLACRRRRTRRRSSASAGSSAVGWVLCLIGAAPFRRPQPSPERRGAAGPSASWPRPGERARSWSPHSVGVASHQGSASTHAAGGPKPQNLVATPDMTWLGPFGIGEVGWVGGCAVGMVGGMPEPVRNAVAGGRSVVELGGDDAVQLRHQGFRYSFRLRHPSSSTESPVLCLIHFHTPHDRWSPPLTCRLSLTVSGPCRGTGNGRPDALARPWTGAPGARWSV